MNSNKKRIFSNSTINENENDVEFDLNTNEQIKIKSLDFKPLNSILTFGANLCNKLFQWNTSQPIPVPIKSCIYLIGFSHGSLPIELNNKNLFFVKIENPISNLIRIIRSPWGVVTWLSLQDTTKMYDEICDTIDTNKNPHENMLNIKKFLLEKYIDDYENDMYSKHKQKKPIYEKPIYQNNNIYRYVENKLNTSIINKIWSIYDDDDTNTNLGIIVANTITFQPVWNKLDHSYFQLNENEYSGKYNSFNHTITYEKHTDLFGCCYFIHYVKQIYKNNNDDFNIVIGKPHINTIMYFRNNPTVNEDEIINYFDNVNIPMLENVNASCLYRYFSNIDSVSMIDTSCEAFSFVTKDSNMKSLADVIKEVGVDVVPNLQMLWKGKINKKSCAISGGGRKTKRYKKKRNLSKDKKRKYSNF
jgi:hypothetical protein